jgi:hypothetical protein
MKKLSILLIGLLLVTGFAFAVDFAPSVTVDGSASITWGIDLNTNYTGFQNGMTNSIAITFVPEGDASKSGEDGLYGKIVLDNFKATAFTLTAPTITGTIVIDPVSIKIYSAPSFSYDKAPVVDDANVSVALGDADNTIGGVTITVPVDPITLKIMAASDGDWLTNSENDYAVGADVTLAVSPVTVELGFIYGFLDAPTLGISAKVSASVAVVGGLDVWAGFDGAQPDGGDFDFDLGAGTTLALTEDNADGNSADVTLASHIYLGDPDTDLDLSIGFSEPEAGGLMDMLSATVAVKLLDVLETLAYTVDVDGAYNTGDLKPYFGFGYGSDEIFDLNVGVYLYAGLTGIDNTTIKLDYVSTDLSTDNGVITAKVTIDY